MIIYAIRYNNDKVSQEGYKTLWDAQNFCLKRGATMVDPNTPYKFINRLSDGSYQTYDIIDIRIR